MNILFIQSRYHANQHPIVKTLLNKGHRVKYITTNSMEESENWECINPDLLSYSSVSEIIIDRLRISKKRAGWPPIHEFYSRIQSFDPDVIISRGYNMRSVISMLVSKILDAEFIIFTQRAKYQSTRSKVSYIRKIYQKFFNKPLIEFTPVKGDDEVGISREHTYYIPFIIDPDYLRPVSEKKYYKNDRLNIISVGQFHLERKNHMLLLSCINEIINEHDIRLTYAGYLKNKSNKRFEDIKSYIQSNGLNNIVSLKPNMNYDDLQKEYFEHDLYILPSKNEPAAVSHLEAMAQVVPAICSDTNGTQWYIDHGENGYIFESDNKDDLMKKIRLMVDDRESIINMGYQSRKKVENNHLPKHFYFKFCSMIDTLKQ